MRVYARGTESNCLPQCGLCEGLGPSELQVYPCAHVSVRARTCICVRARVCVCVCACACVCARVRVHACAWEGIEGALLGGFVLTYIAVPLSQSLVFQRENVS